MSTLQTYNLKHPDASGNQITFTSGGDVNFDNGAVYLDSANNRLGIGTTPAQLLHLSSGGFPTIRVTDADNSTFFDIANSDGDIILKADEGNTFANSAIRFMVDGGEKFRCDASGRLLVGTSSFSGTANNDNDAGLIVEGNASDGGGDGRLFIARGAASLTDGQVLGALAFSASNHDIAAAIEAERDGGTWTAGSSQPTRLVFSTTADGASSPTERMRITNDGNVLVGKTSSSFGTGDGTVIGGAGYLAQTRTSATPVTVIRNGTDGTLVSFEAQNVEEGTISVSGTTVSYNGAHLSRWSQILGIDPYNKDVRPEILRGTVMSNLDEMCDWTCPTSGDCQDNEQLNKTKISDVEGDKNVAGIFQSWDDDDDTWVNDYYLAMTGDFVIRIAEGVTVERGDLLMSAGDGTAKPQADDLVRSCTVAKVTSTNVSCTHPDGSYCVPCVLMAC